LEIWAEKTLPRTLAFEINKKTSNLSRLIQFGFLQNNQPGARVSAAVRSAGGIRAHALIDTRGD
jgi:hypothetical protein